MTNSKVQYASSTRVWQTNHAGYAKMLVISICSSIALRDAVNLCWLPGCSTGRTPQLVAWFNPPTYLLFTFSRRCRRALDANQLQAFHFSIYDTAIIYLLYCVDIVSEQEHSSGFPTSNTFEYFDSSIWFDTVRMLRCSLT